MSGGNSNYIVKVELRKTVYIERRETQHEQCWPKTFLACVRCPQYPHNFIPTTGDDSFFCRHLFLTEKSLNVKRIMDRSPCSNRRKSLFINWLGLASRKDIMFLTCPLAKRALMTREYAVRLRNALQFNEITLRKYTFYVSNDML